MNTANDTIVGNPISVGELFGIIQRIQSGETTLEEECVRNLEKSDVRDIPESVG